MLTASITSPVSDDSSNMLWMKGISKTHGPHQVAQKLSNTGLPQKSLSDTAPIIRKGSPIPRE